MYYFYNHIKKVETMQTQSNTIIMIIIINNNNRRQLYRPLEALSRSLVNDAWTFSSKKRQMQKPSGNSFILHKQEGW